MQQQSNGQNKFLIDADIGDDDVTFAKFTCGKCTYR